MNKKVTALLVVLVAVVAGFAGLFFAMRSSGVNLFQKETTTLSYEQRDFEGKIEYLAERSDASDYERLKVLKAEYEAMSEGDKAKITNYPTLEATLKEVKNKKRLKIINEMDALKEDLTEENQQKILNLILTNKELLTKEDVQSYFTYGIHSRILKDAERVLKKSLPKPDTYKRRKYEIREYAYKIPKKGYEVRVDLLYNAKNSYGKLCKNTRTVYCYYSLTDDAVKLKKSNLSSLDKWKMEH